MLDLGELSRDKDGNPRYAGEEVEIEDTTIHLPGARTKFMKDSCEIRNRILDAAKAGPRETPEMYDDMAELVWLWLKQNYPHASKEAIQDLDWADLRFLNEKMAARMNKRKEDKQPGEAIAGPAATIPGDTTAQMNGMSLSA